MLSMTGMGKTEGVVQNSHLRIEIKSVNHRFCEVNFRAPTRFLCLEILVQQFVKKHLTRGRIDIFVYEDKSAKIDDSDFNAFEQYHQYLKKIQGHLKLDGSITLDNLLGGVNSWMQKELDSKMAWSEFQPLLKQALDEMIAMRRDEGVNLKKGLEEKVEALKGMAQNIREYVSSRKQEIEDRVKEKIQSKIQDFGDLDAARLQTEVIYYLERLDIAEELDRLESHFLQTETFLNKSEPIGRKFDFLIQEFNREFNTIASKAQNTSIAHLVVDAKAEIEKIREQIQNIE